MSLIDSDEPPPSLLQENDIGPYDTNGQLADGSASRVPLTIISGFLGAGKSTLLKRILTERHGYRIAVIMNEFGDTADIECMHAVLLPPPNLSSPSDSSYLAKTINVSSPSDPTAEKTGEFLELANGCLCCSIKDTGIAAIEQLMKRKGGFDYILLETTGLADPGPIASTFWQNEEYATGLADIILDGVVCVVDSVFGHQQMQEDHAGDDLQIGESLRQIAAADVILLNKVDVADPSIVSETEVLIRNINPVAPIHHTIKGEIDLKHIIGISAYKNPPLSTNIAPTGKLSKHEHHVHNDHPEEKVTSRSVLSHDITHYQLRGISSIQVLCPIRLSQVHFDALDEWIRNALWENQVCIRAEGSSLGVENFCQVQVLRCKGAFRDERNKWYVLQGVRSVYEISELEVQQGSQDWERVDVPDQGKIVLIGKGLNEKVKESLERIFVT